MSRKLLRLVPILLIVVVVLGALPATTSARQDPITVTWFIGLGTGGQPEQLEAEQKVVDDFNAMQDAIKLEIIVAENSVAPDTLSTLIASGQAPDIVGPVGGDGANRFYGSWLDLQPLVDSIGYDLSQFPEALVDHFRTDEGLVSIPFATYPSFVFYRPALFDEAGLPYPPAAYGEVYGAGTEYEGEWNMDKVREIAIYLTVDANGNDASMEEFDPENIIQWGFDFQYPNPRQIPTLWGAVSIWDSTNGVVIPESWRAAWDWYYKGMWTDHFYPNASQIGSDLLAAGNPFASGNMGMVVSHSWYTCCVSDTEWQTAADPSYNGVITARLHADTFRIMKDTKNPEAAFEVLSYLTGKTAEDTGASDALFIVYGAMPARETQQEAWIATMNEKFTQGVNWDVVMASVDYSDVPSHEAYLPNFNKVEDLLQSFQTKLDSTPDLDVNAELDQLQADLQAAVDEVQ